MYIHTVLRRCHKRCEKPQIFNRNMYILKNNFRIIIEIQKFCKEKDFSGKTKPRMDSGWIALDYNEIVIHIFTRELRDFYLVLSGNILDRSMKGMNIPPE